MAYGIEIQNADGRIVIDTSYANFGFVSTSTSTAAQGATYPGLVGANTTIDLIAARANTSANGYVSRTYNTWASTGLGAVATNIYYVIRRFTTLNPATATGYGFAVYNSTSNVIFTSNITKNFEIVATGIFNGSVSNATNLAFPSATTWYSDFTKYYAIVNATNLSESAGIPPNNFQVRTCYRWVWANSTHGRILLESSLAFGTSLTRGNPFDTDFHYMIVKELT
jgi:hypothetical protein